jgi:hypothetical protein
MMKTLFQKSAQRRLVVRAGILQNSNQPVTINLQNPEPLPYFTLSMTTFMMLHPFLSAPADVWLALFP